MNVPPLCTVAVRARAQAPNPRLPRKNPFIKPPACIALLASMPIHIDARMNNTSAASVPYPTLGLSEDEAARMRLETSGAISHPPVRDRLPVPEALPPGP